MMGDLTKDNLRVIATPNSTITLNITPLVSSALVESDKIPNNSTYYVGIYFKRLFKYIKPSLDL